MADCKTMMVRRNSKESIGPRCSRTGPPPQPASHFHHNHRNGSRTKSYHQQHNYYNQQYHSGSPFCPNFQNGCLYVTSPPPSHTQPTLEHYSHQFMGPNENSLFGNGNNQQHIPRHQQTQPEPPPPRPWIHLAHHKHKRTCFTVLCYNILCSRYVNDERYSYCPNWALDWNYRRRAILQELIHYAADIISLQEIQTDQYYNFFLPELQLHGYSGIFAAKSRARTMVESEKRLVDGCAIFYKTNKFRLVSEHLIEFRQMAISNAARCTECPTEMLNRVQTKDNIALAALFETKLDTEQTTGLHGLVPRPRPLLVCTCHLYWDPNYCDVKLVQTMMLMKELKKITEGIDIEETPTSTTSHLNSIDSTHTTLSCSSSTSEPSNLSKSCCTHSQKQKNSFDKVNLLLCGDFNSLPQSGVIEFLKRGSISSSHPDFKGFSYKDYIHQDADDGENDNAEERKNSSSLDEFQHDFNLKSVYSENAMPFTNFSLDFQGVIDYIFHSVKGLQPLGLLGPLDPTWIVRQNVVGGPHPNVPSDHLPLLVEMEMIPVI